MQVLRIAYLVYSLGLIFFSFRVISGVLVSEEPSHTIEIPRSSPMTKLVRGILRAIVWPILIFRTAGIRQLFRGE